MNQILIITGPTSSGKSSLAVECAKRFNAEIVSADSMQIYKNLNIGTAKSNSKEFLKIKHHMIDILNPNENFSVQQYSKLAQKSVEEIIAKNKLPIIVGGTGLYIQSLIFPLTFAKSPRAEQIREKYQKILKEKGNEFLYKILQKKDSGAAKTIHFNDSKRVIRALEIFDSTGKKKSQLSDKLKKRYDYVLIILDLPRKELYDKINQRVETMFEKGLEKEVRNLLSSKKVSKNCLSMQAIGYKEFFDYFENKTTLDETKQLIKKHTRNYAKRQITFLKIFKNAHWFNPLTQKQQIFDLIEKEIKNGSIIKNNKSGKTTKKTI